MIDAPIAIWILSISLLTLLQFFFMYCHSLIAKSRGHELSEQAREISGVTARTVRGDQFKRLLGLIALCPKPGGDTLQVCAVSAYFSVLSSLRNVLTWAAPVVAKSVEFERAGCTYAAAVVLDRRIAHSRQLIARQAVPLL